jgi:ligand-binding SRPBCC domain-containing protein
MSSAVHLCETEQFFPRSREELFPFFADAFNLEQITPPWVRFRILTPPPIEMRVGALIDYSLRIRGVPVRWRTEITAWEPPFRFVDEQRRGPYRLWRHEHRFVEESRGVRMYDRVEYRAPGGEWLRRWLVAPDIERIFRYRREVLAVRFGSGEGAAHGTASAASRAASHTAGHAARP